MRFLQVAVCLLAVLLPPHAHACSIFTLVRDGRVLFGNNEDYVKPGIIWFERGNDQRHGRVNVGFDDDFAQGSMNERGLAFDSSALREVPWEEDPGKETPKNLLEMIMDDCATVEEALAFFEKYNCKHLKEAQFMLADATGDAAVVAWLPDKGITITRRETEALVVTNTRLEMSGYRCPRYVRARQVLQERQDASLDTMAAVLEAIHQEGPQAYTSYSTVYDLKERKVYVYNLANFDDVREFDLAEMLGAKRRQVFKLSKLFDNAHTLDDVTGVPQRTTWDTRVELDAATLARYAGRYSPMPEVVVEITRDDAGGLTVTNPDQTEATLVPEGEALFRIAPDRGIVTFQLNDDGTVASLTLHKQADIVARRVD